MPDPDQTAQINHFNEAVQPNLDHSDSLRSDGSQTRSTQIGMSESQAAMCHALAALISNLI
jgi:hypothetical protein